MKALLDKVANVRSHTPGPGFVLRWCDYTEKVVAAHQPVGEPARLWCSGHEASVEWPCQELLDMCQAWGVAPPNPATGGTIRE